MIFVNQHLCRHSVVNNFTNQINDMISSELVLKIKSKLSQEDKRISR